MFFIMSNNAFCEYPEIPDTPSDTTRKPREFLPLHAKGLVARYA